VCDRLLSVLVVNYNGAAHLPHCLDALAVQTLPADRFEVIVFDNGSADGSADAVERRVPNVRLVRAGRNHGFAGGNNLAAGHARGAYRVLLNPDTIPDPFWLEELDRAIGENPGRVIACKLVLADDPTRLNSAGLFLTRDDRGADRGFRQSDDGRYEGGGEVFAGCAAALAVPTGEPLFDADLFLYCEDLEFGWRWRKAGRRVVFAPRAVVRHAVGATHDSPTYWFYSERNRALVALRHGDPVMATAAGLGLFMRAARAVVFALLRHPDRTCGGARRCCPGGSRGRERCGWF
jgi:GT2 family glycosyltransferase